MPPPGKEELEKERKSQGEAQGKFFPLTAAQRYDPGAKQLENGVFLGHVAALTFLGPHDWQRVRRRARTAPRWRAVASCCLLLADGTRWRQGFTRLPSAC